MALSRRRAVNGGGMEHFINLTTGGPVVVDVEDERIVRLRPLELTEED